jgi:hypothetical protein
LGLAGCSSDHSTKAGPVGSAELNLVLPDNTTIDTVGYRVTHSNGYVNEGTVPVSNSTAVTFQVGNIPATTGYAISLTATTSGQVTCGAGPVSFDISAGQTSLIMMTLRCGGGTAATTNGNVRLDVDVQTDAACAQVDGLTVLPRSVIVGSSLALTGFATTAGATFGWTVAPAAGGSFASPAAAMTAFTCNQAGTHTVTLRVASPAPCTASTADVPVICTPPGGAAGSGAAGTGAAGTGAAGTGAAGTGSAGTGAAGTGAAGTGAAGTGVAGTGAAGTGAAGTGAAGTGVAGTGAAGTGAAGTGAAGTGAAGTGAGGSGGPSAACVTCRNTNCRDYMGSGLDLVAGCFEAINTSLGATAGDPTFLQNCVDVMNCAFQNNCAYGVNGASDCYCGSTTPDACIASGPAADAKCVPQFQAATRSTVNADITLRVSDLAYPMGWANFLLECDRDSCRTSCAP